MGVEPEVLNSKEWKQTVKDLVFEAIVSPRSLIHTCLLLSSFTSSYQFSDNQILFASRRKQSRNQVP